MSFNLFLICSHNGEPASFEGGLLDEIMAPDAVKPENFPDNIEYPDGSGGEVLAIGDDRIKSLSFNHFGGDTFMQRIWELADRTTSFFVWPTVGRQIAVTKAENVRHVLPDILENLGPPYIVRSGKELDYVIANDADYPGESEAEAF